MRPALLALSLLAAVPLVAQTHLEVTPAVSAYLPTGMVFDEYDAGCMCHSTIAQQAGVFFGIHLGYGVAGRVNFETTVDFGHSRVLIRQPAEPEVTWAGTIVIVGARLRLNARRGPVTTPFLSAGVAYLNRNSDAYQGISGVNQAAFSLGFGIRVVASAHVIGRLEVEDYHYRTALGPTATPQSNNDLLLSAGIGLTP